jgi:hypothetical protein
MRKIQHLCVTGVSRKITASLCAICLGQLLRGHIKHTKSVVCVYRKNLRTWFCYNFSELDLEALKDVVKNRKSELRKIIEPHYGLLDELVSNGVCDLDQVKVIEDTKSSIEHRKKLVDGLVEKLTSNPAQRKQILDILTRNNQHHVTEFIEQEGRKYRSVTVVYFLHFSGGSRVQSTANWLSFSQHF